MIHTKVELQMDQSISDHWDSRNKENGIICDPQHLKLQGFRDLGVKVICMAQIVIR